jgi:hypothetical protein
MRKLRSESVQYRVKKRHVRLFVITEAHLQHQRIHGLAAAKADVLVRLNSGSASNFQHKSQNHSEFSLK